MLYIEINRSSLIPLYAQLSEAIRSAILNGQLAYGDKLPSENELTACYGLSRMTVRSAMADLVSRKLIEKHQGKGAYVSYNRAQLPLLGSIAVLLDTSYVYFSGYYIHGISSVLSQRGYSFLIHDTWNDQQHIANLLNQVIDQRPLGLILQPYHQNEPLQPALKAAMTRLTESRIPFLFLDRALPGFPVPLVHFDAVKAGMTAADHLTSLGHRRIGMLTYPPFYENALLVEGFNAVLREKGLAPLTEVPALDDWKTPLLDAIRRERLTALYCFNDEYAVQAIRVLNGAGISIPDEISVVGSDDTILATAVTPSLTSVVHPKALLGQCVAEKLLSLIDGTDYSVPVSALVPSMHVRASSGSAPAGCPVREAL